MIAFAPFMSSKPEQSLVETKINGLDFARDGRRLVGVFPLVRLERLADVLLDQSGELRCEIRGERDEQQDSFLHVIVSGELKLRCQRCLEQMNYPLRVDSRLRLMRAGDEWPEDELEDDTSDAIEAGLEMALLPLVEEEVLLAMPFAPSHDVCDPPAAVKQDKESSPFAVLAKLKK